MYISFDKITGVLSYNTWTSSILFYSYEDKGWKDSGWIYIPGNSDFAFRIMSNFGFGNSAYLKCGIKYQEQMLVNSEGWCETERLLTYWEEQPTPDYWENLFRHITNAYKKRDAWNCNNILNAANKLNYYMSNPESLEVSKHYWSKTPLKYSPLRKRIHLIKKCNELIKLIQKLKLTGYDNIMNVVSETCEKVIALIFNTYEGLVCESSNSANLRGTHLEQNIECFNTIYFFLRDTNQYHLLFDNKILLTKN